MPCCTTLRSERHVSTSWRSRERRPHHGCQPASHHSELGPVNGGLAPVGASSSAERCTCRYLGWRPSGRDAATVRDAACLFGNSSCSRGHPDWMFSGRRLGTCSEAMNQRLGIKASSFDQGTANPGRVLRTPVQKYEWGIDIATGRCSRFVGRSVRGELISGRQSLEVEQVRVGGREEIGA